MGKGKGAIRKRRNWRNQAFAKLDNRSLAEIPKHDVRNPRSDVLRRVLGKKALHGGE